MVIDLNNEDLSVKDNNTEFLDRKYTIDDCILVRKTSAFPFNGVVTTPRHGKATIKGMSELTDAQVKELINQFIIDHYGDIKSTDYNKYMAALDTVEENFKLTYASPRDTIHVCINGTVGNHALGTFNGDFAVMDEFSKHVDDSLVCVRGEDTYFNDDISISKIVMSQDKYNSLKDDLKYKDTLDQLQVFIYDSHTTSLDDACTMVLHYLGYDSLTMSSSYIQGNNGIMEDEETLLRQNKATLMTNFLYELANEHHLDTGLHFYSKYSSKESMELGKITQKNDINHLFYLVSHISKLSDDEKEKFREELYANTYAILNSNSKDSDFNEVLNRLFSYTNFEEVANLIKQYNQEYVEALNNNQEMNLYYDESKFIDNQMEKGMQI